MVLPLSFSGDPVPRGVGEVVSAPGGAASAGDPYPNP